MNLLNTMSWPLLLWSGLTAYLASTWTLMVLRKLNATRYLPRAYWSCAFTGGASTFGLLVGGLARLICMCALFPFAYAFLFARLFGAAEVLPGLLLGLAHGVLAGLALPLAARRCKGSKPPGIFGWNLGRATPVVLLVVHAIYGALIGYVYVLATRPA